MKAANVYLSMLDLSKSYLKCCIMLVTYSCSFVYLIYKRKMIEINGIIVFYHLIELWMSLIGWYWPRWSNIWVIFQTCKMIIFNFPVVCLANIIKYLPSVYFSEVMTSFFVQRPWCNAFLEMFKHLNAKNEWTILHSI